MTISKNIAKAMVFGSIAIAALIYSIFINTLSETDMVMLAYIWVPIFVTGAYVWATGRNTLKYVIAIFVTAFLSLFVFFEIIFPML